MDSMAALSIYVYKYMYSVCIICIYNTYCRSLVMYVLCTNYVKPAH